MNKRVEIEPLGHSCWQVVLHYGFKNDPDVPRALEQIRARGCEIEQMKTSYFLSRDTVDPDASAAAWRRGAKSCSRRCTTTPARRRTS